MILVDLRVPEPARVALARDLRAVLPVVFAKLESPTQAAVRKQLGTLHDVLKPGALRDALPAMP